MTTETARTSTATPRDRETTALRLLRSSAENSYDPEIEIDWSAPLAEDRFYAPPKRVSLYGTELWEGMDRAQRIELSKHEVASLASVGIQFELILMQMLIRHAYRRDPTSRHVQYALTEIGDECRHSVMFGRLIERLGCPRYGFSSRRQTLGGLLAAAGSGTLLFAAALIVEEMLDALQREAMADESLQPVVRMVSRIHVVEEARHVRFARDEIGRRAGRMSRRELAWTRLLLGRTAYDVADSLIQPRAYAAVGLDPVAATRAARANPFHRETVAFAGRKVIGFLVDSGLVGHPGLHWWRRSNLL